MFVLNNFDYFIFTIVVFLSVIGLLRGFLKEISTIINWFSTIYLTSLAKPYFVKIFEDKIKIPFLLDLILNSVLFIFFIIIISLITKKIRHLCSSVIPGSLNTALGAIFGFIKGALISMFIIGIILILNNEKDIKYFNKSLVYSITENKMDDVKKVLLIIFGDFIENNKEFIKDPKHIEKQIKKIEDNVNKKIEKTIDKKIENIKSNIEKNKENFEEINFEQIDELEELLKKI